MRTVPRAQKWTRRGFAFFTLRHFNYNLLWRLLLGSCVLFLMPRRRIFRRSQVHVHRENTLRKICAEMSKEEFLRRMGDRNLILLISSASPTKRNVAVFVTRINVGESTMVVKREYQIPQVVYRAVFWKTTWCSVCKKRPAYQLQSQAPSRRPACSSDISFLSSWWSVITFSTSVCIAECRDIFWDLVNTLLLNDWKLRVGPSNHKG